MQNVNLNRKCVLTCDSTHEGKQANLVNEQIELSLANEETKPTQLMKRLS